MDAFIVAFGIGMVVAAIVVILIIVGAIKKKLKGG